MKEEKVEVLISREDISKRVEELAKTINEEYAGTPLLLVGILKGSIAFLWEIMKKLDMPVEIDFMSVSSYGFDTIGGALEMKMDLGQSIEGKNVLIIEDIVDTGRTLSLLRDILEKRNPKSLKICTLLDKPERRLAQVDVEYVGFIVPDKFVVGYGLDYAQRYRNLDYIGVLSFLGD